jgi:seryl-tRNA synthetase
MLDIQLLRSQPAAVAARLATRGVTLSTWPPSRRSRTSARACRRARTQELQAKRNSLSKQIGQLKAKGEDAAAVMAEVAGLGDELKRNEESARPTCSTASTPSSR